MAANLGVSQLKHESIVGYSPECKDVYKEDEESPSVDPLPGND
jgi:hypothetical protein